MSEYSSQERRSRTVPLWALFVVSIVAALAAYWLIAAFRVTWDPVAYIPQDCVAAVVVDVTGSGDKKAALASIEKSLKEAGIDDPGQALVDRVNKAFGVRFERDVVQHLNGRGAAVVIPEMSGVTPGAGVIIGARGDKGAAAVKELMVNGITRGQYKISEQSYKHFNYAVVPNDKFKSYIGVVKGGVVYATTEFAFKKIVDTVKGGECLRDNAEFKRMNKTDDSTVATLFFSGTQCEKMVGPMMALGARSMMVPGLTNLPDAMKDNVAAVGVLNAKADCLTLRVNGITRKPRPSYGPLPLEKLAAVAPEDAAIAFAINGWDKTWAAIKAQLMADASMKAQIDQVTSQAKTFLFMDPFADGLDRITMLGGYYVPGKSTDNSFPGHFTLAAQVDKPEVVGTTVGKVHFAMAMSGGTAFSEVTVAGKKAYLGPNNGPVRFSDAMVGDEFVLIVSGKKPGAAVSSAVLTAAGKGQSLAKSAKFKSIQKHLPDKACALVYCDLGAAMEPFGALAGANVKKQDKAVLDTFGRFAFTSSASGTEYEVCGALPLGD